MVSREKMDLRVIQTARARGDDEADLVKTSNPPIVDAEMMQDFLLDLEKRLKKLDKEEVDLLGAPGSEFPKLVGKSYGELSVWAFKRQES
jgi:hypothetical protein